MIGDSGKPSVLRLRGSCGRRLRGMSWEQVWMAGQISTRCSNTISSWRERACMQPEACCWQRLRRRAGRRSGDIELGWWTRRFARDARKPMRTCSIEFGSAEPTQVRSLTRAFRSKSHSSQRHIRLFLAQGSCATILDFATHEVGFLATIWKWRIDRSLYLHLWGRLGDAQRSANQARGMVRGHCSGYVKLPWTSGNATVRGS